MSESITLKRDILNADLNLMILRPCKDRVHVRWMETVVPWVGIQKTQSFL